MCAFLLQFLELNNLADHSWTQMAGVPGGLYPGSIPYHGELPSEQELPLQKNDGERMSASLCIDSVGAMLHVCGLHEPLQYACISACLHGHAGCRRAELLKEATKKIGSTPLETAILQYPVETWRVWSSTYPRKYTEDSKVCTALPTEHEGYKTLSPQHQTPVQFYGCMSSHFAVADERQMSTITSNIEAA